MSCAQFQRWLDDGRPDSERSRMMEHSAQCRRCRQELAAAVEIERSLAAACTVAVSPGFNDVVLRRIHSRTQSGWRRALGGFAQVMAEPHVPLSLAVTLMAGWYHEVLALQVTAAADRLTRAIDRLPLSGDLTIVRALAVAIIIFYISWGIFRVAASANP